MTERQIQKYTVKLLRLAGYRVFVTSNNRHTANTKGTPDIFAFKSGIWYAIECKSDVGKPSKEQSELLALGATYIVSSFEDVQNFLEENK